MRHRACWILHSQHVIEPRPEARQLGSGDLAKGWQHLSWDQRRSQASIVLGRAFPGSKCKWAGTSLQKLKEDQNGWSNMWSQRKRGERAGRQGQIIKDLIGWNEEAGLYSPYPGMPLKSYQKGRDSSFCFPTNSLLQWCIFNTVATRNQSLVGTLKVQVSSHVSLIICAHFECLRPEHHIRFSTHESVDTEASSSWQPLLNWWPTVHLNCRLYNLLLPPYATITPQSPGNSIWFFWSSDFSLWRTRWLART